MTLWNPYDPHSVAGFFDSEYMFGLSGFDIVIGNPPYGATYPAEHKPIFKKHYKSARTINEKEAKRLYPAQWQDKLQVGSLNTYSLFIEQELQSLRYTRHSKPNRADECNSQRVYAGLTQAPT